jgi:hypothetical protein
MVYNCSIHFFLRLFFYIFGDIGFIFNEYSLKLIFELVDPTLIKLFAYSAFFHSSYRLFYFMNLVPSLHFISIFYAATNFFLFVIFSRIDSSLSTYQVALIL